MPTEEISQETSLADLPKEILLNNILGQLPFSSRYSLRKVSKQFSAHISHCLTDFAIRSYLIAAQPREAMEAIQFIITHGPRINYKPADQTLRCLLKSTINWTSSRSTLEKAREIAEQERVERFKNSLKILEYALKLHIVNGLGYALKRNRLYLLKYYEDFTEYTKALNDFNEVLKWASHLKGTNAPLKSFPNIDLSIAELKEANLEWARLQGVNLEEVDLEEAHLEGANLERASLERANLKRANLEGVNLRWAKLQMANLEGANLQGVDLRGAKLEGANLRWTKLQGAHLKWANLQGALLEGANLEGANLEGVDLEGAGLEGANLSWVHLERANLERARLRGIHLEGADLEKAILIGVNLKNIDISCAKNFQNVILLTETQKPEKLKYELDQFINNINGSPRELQLRELAIKRYLKFLDCLRDSKVKEALLFCILDHAISKFTGHFLTVFLKNELINMETDIYKEIRKRLEELQVLSGNSLSR